MKLLLAAAILLVASQAVATPVDEYVACLIGQSAVALHAQSGKKDASLAQEKAFALCPEPKEVAANPESDGLFDFVNLAVESIATGVWPSTGQ
ncbi:hypothetical protein [Mesorhizobium sp. KR9-304]|uniref:hypothetical protein n=1 Tax=Mesorhizobium sp. KR9-304 TaxID=3156614 RepID=UPI0032B5A7C0